MRGDINTNISVVGNDFIVPKNPPLRPAFQTVTSAAVALPMPALTLEPPITPKVQAHRTKSNRSSLLDLIHEQSVIVFALLFLMVGVAIIEFGSSYIIAHDFPAQTTNYDKTIASIGGLNKTVSSANLASFMSGLTSQTATLNLGGKTISISPATIKSWLTITSNPKTNENYIHIDAANVTSSITALVNQYVVAPVNQITATYSDGTSQVVVNGVNGTQLNSSANIGSQAITIAKNLFSNQGFSVNAPLVTVPFQAVTPAAFSKLIIARLDTKEMYLYQNGQIVNTFAVSAGKPSTPTPVGLFHIWDKARLQTMTGPGYVQPNVPWINYFDHSGDAIHGVYWRPASVFGSVNTSHGCVGVPVNTGEYIYNWAPIGTPVITVQS